VFIPAINGDMPARIKQVEEIIKAETNIKEVDLLAAGNDFIKKKAKANFKSLGKKLGARMKWASEQIALLDNMMIEQVQAGNFSLSDGKSEPILLNEEDIEVSTDEIPGFEVASKGNLTVALDVVITEDLKKEGDAREFVNRIQNIRKDQGFDLTDRIKLTVMENTGLQPSLNEYKTYICAEILADSLEFVPVIIDGTEIEVNDVQLKVNVVKKGV
jgi:isoleucyl-tRNA synthetase